ncbi:related to Transformer-2 protein [Serendipita indica DSM 11827]|uniref:Related to Transformer-2 protein n=1 Tax=Serendipita indica (strain DSM 11827) TaxID=1109443 RepID=G4TVI2_SERID|nr:related to Transformer-2 protein [Serendipita indica DSM 11827]
MSHKVQLPKAGGQTRCKYESGSVLRLLDSDHDRLTTPSTKMQNSQAPPPSSQDAPRGRSRSRSPPARNGSSGHYRSPPPRSPGGGGGGGGNYRRRSPGPRKPNHAPSNPTPSNVLGVFGLSIRTQERDLEDEFSRFGRVEKVTIVYDQRTDRSRGFGFIVMNNVEEATRCVQELNGVVSTPSSKRVSGTEARYF